MTKIAFFKYEALGNDFILIPKKPCLDANKIRQLCDRHRGIGADGIIFVYLDQHWTMKVFNSDGSRAPMCGNGIRCVAQYLKDHAAAQSPIFIQSDSGIK